MENRPTAEQAEDWLQQTELHLRMSEFSFESVGLLN